MGNLDNKITVNTTDYDVRIEQYEGREHLIVPVVMMVEGVHNGSRGPVYHSADELGHMPIAFDGIPVTIQHPQDNDNNFISANSPNVLKEYAVGRVFNSHFENNKLKGEVWIDVQRIAALSPEALQYIQDGSPLDVSLGVFTDEEEVNGEWNGENYIAIASNHRADHLALLPGGVGACSWNDGCGIRVNNEKKKGGNNVNSINVNTLRYEGTESTKWSAPSLLNFNVNKNWSDLNDSEKSDIAKHFLIGNSSSENYEDLKFPVVNPDTGKLNEHALRSVIDKNGTEVYTDVKKHVYQLLNSKFSAGLIMPETIKAIKEISHNGFYVQEISCNVETDLIDLAEKARYKLDRMDDDVKVHYLQAIYSDYLIYEVRRRDEYYSTELYKRDYSITDNGDIEFTSDPVKVQKNVEYVVQTFKRTKFNNNQINKQMTDKKHECHTCEEKIVKLIANSATNFTDDDREWLTAMSEDQLDKLTPKEVKKEPEVNTQKPIEALSDDDKAALAYGKAQLKARRSQLVSSIQSNASGVWEDTELNAMELEQLEKIEKSIKPIADYSGAGGTYKSHETDQEEVMFPTGYGESNNK